MSIEVPFTKANLDLYLKELGKEYRKRSGGVPAEITLIGGASVLINYGFRESTYDVDATYDASGAMSDAIAAVEQKFDLQHGWLNSDFTRTDSYTPRLMRYSEYYRTYSNVLTIRTIRAEYLVAMKLVSGRRYKKDLSDIIGILYEQERAGKPLNDEMIDRAMYELYDGWDMVDGFAEQVLVSAFASDDLEALFIRQSEDEAEAKAAILEVNQKYPKAVNQDNVNDVITAALAKKKRDSREER